MGGRDAALLDLLGETEAAREYAFSRADFERVRALILSRAGISLNESKETMVYGRLARRLRATGCGSFREYLDRLEGDAAFAAAEGQEFVNALTTNLTAFFREPHHFPILAEFARAHARRPLRIWCAASSTGEEPYSIAMTLIEALGAQGDARVLATDIDTRVLATAQRGVYKLESARACGEARLKRFFLRGRGGNDGMVRVKPDVARIVRFEPLNLLDANWQPLASFARELDAVFCRNVMIYFDKPTQRRIVGRIARALRAGGLLFVGHSENFSDCREWFVLRGKTVYERLP
ncbi:MAG: chemotaxis protein CheR [Burkholderiaceae bacterium]